MECDHGIDRLEFSIYEYTCESLQEYDMFYKVGTVLHKYEQWDTIGGISMVDTNTDLRWYRYCAHNY